MGLDLTLAGLVLLMGVRGWFRGFVLQAIRLTGLIACVYAAEPVRNLIKPRVVGSLPTIRPDLVDRLLWWSSAVVSYVVMVGLATLLVKMYHRKPPEAGSERNDQSAGFFFGVVKGLVVASFLLAAVDRYALAHLSGFPWAVRQVENSWSLKWNADYRPAARIWAAPPVQHWVSQVQRQGIGAHSEETRPGAEPVASAGRTPQLSLPPGVPPGLDRSGLDPESAWLVESIQDEIRRLEQAPVAPR